MAPGKWWGLAKVGCHPKKDNTSHHSCDEKGTARQEKPLKEGGSKREDGHARNAIMEYGTVTYRSSYV
jgi:hypothetical protein